MMIDTALKRVRKRSRFALTFVTPEPFIDHFGVGGIGMAPHMIQDEFADRHIESIVNATIKEARAGCLVLERMLKLLVTKGAKIGVCGTCMDARGIKPESLVEGAKRSSMDELTAWTHDADKVLVF